MLRSDRCRPFGVGIGVKLHFLALGIQRAGFAKEQGSLLSPVQFAGVRLEACGSRQAMWDPSAIAFIDKEAARVFALRIEGPPKAIGDTMFTIPIGYG